jgi:hypothetical protein
MERRFFFFFLSHIGEKQNIHNDKIQNIKGKKEKKSFKK